MSRPFLLLVLLGLSAPLAAAPQSVVPLKRMTVGPYDNFQATVDESESKLYYTRSENLSSQVMLLDLKTGLSSPVTEISSDAKTPALSPNGSTLALNSFRSDAKGDICLFVEVGKELNCLTEKGVADHSPVWIGNDRLAYISSDDSGKQSKLKIYDLKSKKTEEIFAGELYAPDLSPDAKTLVYKGRRNELNLYDLTSRKILRTLLVDLPGLTGPSRFSSDGRYLYFAQYMLDSNRDLIIDGRDAAAIFRFDLQNANVLPVQMTSLDTNCSFPYASKTYLYMTCAFEGALDIYRGPLNGVVPQEWSRSDLLDSHQVARSYSDRILFLNHLNTRHYKLEQAEYEDRMMQNFVYAGELQPALYYLDKRLAAGSVRSKDLAYWKIIFASTLRWEVLPQKRNLGAFASFLDEQRKQLAALPKGPEADLTRAYLDAYAQKPEAAKNLLTPLRLKDSLSLYLHVQLAKLVLKDGASNFLKSHALHAEQSEENRLFYLSQWLALQDETAAGDTALEGIKAQLSGSALTLVENEQELRALVRTTDKKEGTAIYRKIVKRVAAIRDDYFAMRLLFNRAIVVFYKHKRSRDLADVVSLWLSYLKADSKEFPYAVEAMRQNSLDLAYQFYHGKPEVQNFAIGAFYDSIRTSDDLESHYQYALLNFQLWPDLQKNYANMVSQGLIKAESLSFVETVRKIVNAPKPLEAGDYKDAAESVQKIDDTHLGSGVKHLFLAYLYHKQLELKSKGYKYDQDLADQAHKAYLFAIDAGHRNDRIQAAALQGLGILHLQIRNFTLAAEFLSARSQMGYSSPLEEQAVRWLWSKALSRSYRSKEAYDALHPSLDLSPENPSALHEKLGFYAWGAGDYTASEQHYAALNARAPGPRLSYAFALLKNGKSAEAQTLLDGLAQELDGKDVIKADAPGLVEQPLKQRFIALGLKAQAKDLPLEARIEALQKRLPLFAVLMDNAKTLHLQAEALSDQRIKEQQDLALLYKSLAQNEQASSALAQSLKYLKEHGEEYSYLNSTVMTGLKNAWLMALPLDQTASQPIVQALDKEFRAQDTLTPLVVQKWAEVKLIQAAYSDRRFDSGSKALFEDKAIAFLKTDKPAQFEELARYRDAIGRSVVSGR